MEWISGLLEDTTLSTRFHPSRRNALRQNLWGQYRSFGVLQASQRCGDFALGISAGEC